MRRRSRTQALACLVAPYALRHTPRVCAPRDTSARDAWHTPQEVKRSRAGGGETRARVGEVCDWRVLRRRQAHKEAVAAHTLRQPPNQSPSIVRALGALSAKIRQYRTCGLVRKERSAVCAMAVPDLA
eukprot:299877-Rhodomonas_salina.2